jgi:hypothetical protein
MARKIVKLPSMSRVVAGSVATLELPVGPTYRRVIFTASGTALAAAHIGKIDVLINGKVIQSYKDYTRLSAINAYYNRGADAVTQFAVHFERAELMDAIYRRAPGIGTADIQTMHFEITLAAGAPADIAMSANAEVDPAPQPLGVFYKIREYPFSSSVAGVVEVDKLPKGPWYSAIHLWKADVNNVECEVNQVMVINATKTVLERVEKESSIFRRVPQTASCTHVDFVTEGDLAQCLRTDDVQDFRLRMTLGTSGSVDITTETIDTLQ